jgi:hypothetical protein
VAAQVSARELRRTTQLFDARAQLRRCSVEGCPIAIRTQCREWLDDVELQIPTVVLAATSDAGDEQDVRVSIDGQPTLERLEGNAIEVTPGPHAFRFEAPGYPATEVRVVVALGEKNRPIRVRLLRHQADAPAARRSEPVKPKPVASPSRRAAWVLGGSALVLLTAAGSFAAVGLSERERAKSDCAPFCGDERAREVKRWFLLADIAGATGALLAGGSVYFFFHGESAAGGSNAGLGLSHQF